MIFNVYWNIFLPFRASFMFVVWWLADYAENVMQH